MAFHCTSIKIGLKGDNRTLFANAQTADGLNWPYSSINLDDCIGNNDGEFQWSGVNFSLTAKNVHLAPDVGKIRLVATLQRCDGCWVGPKSIDLGEKIENIDGKLVFRR